MSDTDHKYAPTVWGAEKFQDLECPSGQICQVRMPGMQAMIAAGVLESADTLTSLVDQKHIKRVQGRPNEVKVDPQSIMKDPESLRRVFTTVDRVVEHMVVQPDVQRPIRQVPKDDNSGQMIDLPLPPAERVDGVIYTDMIDLADRMFIFQYAVGGSTDVEDFRGKFAESMGSVAAS